MAKPPIRLINGRPVTTSREIAEYFHKRHDHVTAKIESLECSEQFLTTNFSGVKFEHRGNEYTEYQITRDGFAFLAMGFTGKKAARFKEDYITAFNKMEEQLHQQCSILNHPNLTKTDANKLRRVVSKFLRRLSQSKSTFESKIMVDYFAKALDAYSPRAGMESRLGFPLDRLVGLSIANCAILGGSPMVEIKPITTAEKKWLSDWIDYQNWYGVYSSQLDLPHIPE